MTTRTVYREFFNSEHIACSIQNIQYAEQVIPLISIKRRIKPIDKICNLH